MRPQHNPEPQHPLCHDFLCVNYLLSVTKSLVILYVLTLFLYGDKNRVVASLVTTSPSIIHGCIINACLDMVLASVLNYFYIWLKRTTLEVS